MQFEDHGDTPKQQLYPTDTRLSLFPSGGEGGIAVPCARHHVRARSQGVGSSRGLSLEKEHR
jgi:hypothetical protein